MHVPFDMMGLILHWICVVVARGRGVVVARGALPFRRWRVCKVVKTPSFSIALIQRPHIFHNLTQRPNIFFLKKWVLSPKARPFFQTIWNFSRKDAQFLTKTSKRKSKFFIKFGAIFTEWPQNFGKFWQFWVTLAYSHPMPPYFFSSLSPNAPGFGSLSLTPISISYWSAPRAFHLSKTSLCPVLHISYCWP